jgi:uracil-DNA glycosylase
VALTDWNPILRAEFEKPYWLALRAFVAQERASHEVFPPPDQEFAALHLTPYADVKVLLLGQDPYHGPGQAHGLCFSVSPPTPPPPSLKNIFKELESDVGFSPVNHGSLEHWATQGVLLLNATLTVRKGQAASHQRQGWERFTDEVIKAVNAKQTPVVFILWGSAAGKKQTLIDSNRHHIVSSVHPSPLSAHRGFFGSKPFSTTNDHFRSNGQAPIDWQLPSH